MSREGASPPVAALRRKLGQARLKGREGPVEQRARALLDVYLATAETHGMPHAALVRSLADGTAAMRIAGADLEAQASRPDGPAARAACAPGCAYCCILSGSEGAVITHAEAQALFAALAPLAHRPDGRAWHPRACPALDPETRQCRAYAARPLICRSYLSPDVAACRAVAEGEPRPGPGVLGAQGVALAVHAFARAVLGGTAKVPTYALSQVAQGAVEGRALPETLKAARHRPRVLDDERTRLGSTTRD